MNRIVLGLLVGAGLGVLDGLTAWFTPEVRKELLGIVFGSTFKGLVAGLMIGFFALKVNKLAPTLIFGMAVAALFAFLVANMQGKYYFEIMLPGSLVGLLTGYATMRYGKSPQLQPAS